MVTLLNRFRLNFLSAVMSAQVSRLSICLTAFFLLAVPVIAQSTSIVTTSDFSGTVSGIKGIVILFGTLVIITMLVVSSLSFRAGNMVGGIAGVIGVIIGAVVISLASTIASRATGVSL